MSSSFFPALKGNAENVITTGHLFLKKSTGIWIRFGLKAAVLLTKRNISYITWSNEAEGAMPSSSISCITPSFAGIFETSCKAAVFSNKQKKNLLFLYPFHIYFWVLKHLKLPFHSLFMTILAAQNMGMEIKLTKVLAIMKMHGKKPFPLFVICSILFVSAAFPKNASPLFSSTANKVIV